MGVYQYDKTNDELKLIAGGTLYADAPVGSIQAYGGTIAPSGWLLCQGQAVSRTEYAELFKAIGIAFGAGDGSTTFNIPDLREATTKGVGLSGKSSIHYDNDGIALGEFVDDRIKSHAHNVYVRDAGHAHSLPQSYGAFPAGGAFSVPYIAGGSDVGTNTNYANIQVSSTPTFTGEANMTADTGSRTNEVKAVGVNYIIKAKQVSVPFDVAEYIRNQNVLSELENFEDLGNNPYTCPYDGIALISTGFSANNGYLQVLVNSQVVAVINMYGASGSGADIEVNTVTVPLNKGDVINVQGTVVSKYIYKVSWYKLRDYTGR